MARAPADRRPLDLTKDAAPERLEQGRPALTPAVRWSLILVWFMRLTALVWIAKGLLSWAVILGVEAVGGAPFEQRSLGHQSTIIYFATIDLVAAVGLWLTSTWGGVLWLLAVMSHLILILFFPNIIAADSLTVGLFSGLLVAYLLISWLAASADER